MDKFEVGIKLERIRHLLFLMGDTFEKVQDRSLKYRAKEKESASRLAYEIDRSIDELETLRDVVFDKVLELEKNFKE
ncbi:hypothetical protein [Enterococcus sp. BWR-S5]|uniref:hypothetical protein n=1 Tax=Enterococcus sp. BWR-S5 TaxID=2787714 RepID=UPI001921E88F|nr:hypothetical protein [Enterococcus sp. BWR-S5]MBL1223717.1 hypothetical protein [Enterococcus sp. BWR-S5]